VHARTKKYLSPYWEGVGGGCEVVEVIPHRGKPVKTGERNPAKRRKKKEKGKKISCTF